MAIDGPDDLAHVYAGTGYENAPVQTLPEEYVTGHVNPSGPLGGDPADTSVPNFMDLQNSGGGGIMDFIKSLGSSVSGMGITPQMLAYLGTAYNQYNNSGKYMDLATKYADQMNPFGKERPYYQDRLRQMTEDPNKYLESSPDYQAAYRQGMGALDRSLAMKGYAGSGTGGADTMRFASDLGAKYLDRDRQSLMTMAGANIGPQSAADLIKTGIQGSMQSQSDALASLTAALTGGKDKNTNPDGNNNTNPDGSPKTVEDIFKQITNNPASYAKAIQDLIKRGWSSSDAIAAIKAMVTGNGTNWTQNGEPYDPVTNPDGYHPYPHRDDDGTFAPPSNEDYPDYQLNSPDFGGGYPGGGLDEDFFFGP